jgi:hypothetical protein
MQKKKLSDAHKKAISQSMTGKKIPETTREAVKTRLKEKHHNRYEWILINPKGEIVRTSELREFCKRNRLSYSILRHKFQEGDSRPVLRGPSRGWIVFSAKKIKTE